MRRALLELIGIASTVGVAACNSSTVTEPSQQLACPAVFFEQIGAAKTSLNVGDTVRVALKQIVGCDALAPDPGATYASSSTSVATVDANGLVMAHNLGSVIITGTSSVHRGMKATLSFDVK